MKEDKYDLVVFSENTHMNGLQSPLTDTKELFPIISSESSSNDTSVS